MAGCLADVSINNYSLTANGEVSPMYDMVTISPPSSSASSLQCPITGSGGGGGVSTTVIICAAVIPGVIVSAACIVVILILCRRRKLAKDKKVKANGGSGVKGQRPVFGKQASVTFGAPPPDVVVSEGVNVHPAGGSDSDAEGADNLGFSQEGGGPEKYDLDNASSIAQSDVYDYASYYHKMRKSDHQQPHHQQRLQPASHRTSHAMRIANRAARNRQSPASVSEMGVSVISRQSPANR